MPGKMVNSRPIFEKHEMDWGHRYFMWCDGYWRAFCGPLNGEYVRVPYPADAAAVARGAPGWPGEAPWDAPWEDPDRWGGLCDLMVKSDAMHPNSIESTATWMHGQVSIRDPSDPVYGIEGTGSEPLVIAEGMGIRAAP